MIPCMHCACNSLFVSNWKFSLTTRMFDSYFFCFADQIQEIQERPEESLKKLIELMNDDPECQGDKQNILFIDEVSWNVSNQDCINPDLFTMTLKINLDVILIVRPSHLDIPSFTDNTYVHCLKTRHRNPFLTGILSEHYYRVVHMYLDDFWK